MRKRRAIILFGGFAVLLIAYLAWCASPLFRKPELVCHASIPTDAQSAILGWRPYKSPGPHATMMWEILRNFADPYRVDRFKADAYPSPADGHIDVETPPFSASLKLEGDRWVWVPYVGHGRIIDCHP